MIVANRCTHITEPFICSFLAKLMVEEIILELFLGWVAGFFLSRDLTVLVNAFSLPSLVALKVFKEDSLSFMELSLTFSMFSYWVAHTLFWISFYNSIIFF